MSVLQKRVPPVPKTPRNSIDAVLDTTPAKLVPPSRLALSNRPSWIGPKPAERVITPGGTSMKLPFTIEFESPGLQPPVFICTSLTDPQWEPVEMEHTIKDDGSNHFKMSFQAEEGEYQYKLRLGPGDWWVCDDSKPTVDDGSGNKNNSVVVTAEPKRSVNATPAQPLLAQLSSQPSASSLATTTQITNNTSLQGDSAHRGDIMHSADVPPTPNDSIKPAVSDSHVHDVAVPHAPLMAHEVELSSESHAPLFRHESMELETEKRSHPASRASPSTVRSQTANVPMTPDKVGDLPTIAVSPPGLAAVNHSPPSLSAVREAEEADELPTTANYEDVENEREPVNQVGERPAALITPPLTPKEREFEALQEKVLEDLASEAVGLAVAEAVVEAEAKNLQKERNRETKKVQYGPITIALGFSVALAAIVIGVWLSGSHDGVMI